jgi:hypothetical protein
MNKDRYFYRMGLIETGGKEDNIKLYNIVACFPGNATSNLWVADLITRFIWTFTLRSYNYLLHDLNHITEDCIFSVRYPVARVLLTLLLIF